MSQAEAAAAKRPILQTHNPSRLVETRPFAIPPSIFRSQAPVVVYGTNNPTHISYIRRVYFKKRALEIEGSVLGITILGSHLDKIYLDAAEDGANASLLANWLKEEEGILTWLKQKEKNSDENPPLELSLLVDLTEGQLTNLKPSNLRSIMDDLCDLTHDHFHGAMRVIFLTSVEMYQQLNFD